MEPLQIIKDIDIFENPVATPKFYVKRATAKGIVLDDEGNIALLSIRGHSLFPGGGVEKHESSEEAFIRECKEEIGCDVIVVGHLGRYDQYRAHQAKKYEIDFFVAYTHGEKGAPTTTDKSELDLVLTWDAKMEVKRILEEQIEYIPDDEYALHFNARTHLAAFMRYCELYSPMDEDGEAMKEYTEE